MDSQNAVSNASPQNPLFKSVASYINDNNISHDYATVRNLEQDIYILHHDRLWVNLVKIGNQGFTLDVFPVNLKGKPLLRCRHHICNQQELATAIADYASCRQSEAWTDIQDLPALVVLDGLLQFLLQPEESAVPSATLTHLRRVP